MVRTIFTCAVVALVGLASSAYAQTYADFNLDTNVGLTYASPASVIQATFGTIEQTKAVCSEIPDCIGVLYRT